MTDMFPQPFDRLEQVRRHAPWLLPLATVTAMFTHPQVPFEDFTPYLEPPSPKVTAPTLRDLAKLAALGHVTLPELKAFVLKRFHAFEFTDLAEHHVDDLISVYEEYGATYGPALFAQDVRSYLAGEHTERL